MFFQSVIFRFVVYTVGKSQRISQFVSFRACSFYYGGIANLRKRIRHQMKTRLSLRRINSAACGNHREPRGCCITHSFTFGFTTRFLQNATEESYRNKAIQACLPSCNSGQYFLQIFLKSSGFFLLEKSIRRKTSLWGLISFPMTTSK